MEEEVVAVEAAEAAAFEALELAARVRIVVVPGRLLSRGLRTSVGTVEAAAGAALERAGSTVAAAEELERTFPEAEEATAGAAVRGTVAAVDACTEQP